MNLFDHLTDQILINNRQLDTLRPVVEKEILHQDILREMARGGFLKKLTFIGGTCLRDCYNSPRLSEDLDFTGGIDFKKNELSKLGRTLRDKISERYGMSVEVSEPHREFGDTSTWKIKIITRPERPDLPAQRIHIDICSVSSFDRKPTMLLNHYQVDMGTSGLILYAESREEILADKILAFVLRSNRVKQRDLWDIVWLNNQIVKLRPELIYPKLRERNIAPSVFLQDFGKRIESIRNKQKDFLFEIRRFLPSEVVNDTLKKPEYWNITISLIEGLHKTLLKELS
ncbi:MAG: nucleotidyl transferase AbiEii/AbiGii toxin family protein [Spirochaetota bacterium]|nr:nucleotidyl transferase AbiEii/AbiGii toxin family protein [Spirochaetota bacterium]